MAKQNYDMIRLCLCLYVLQCSQAAKNVSLPNLSKMG